jgi:hypothetical protein
MVFSCFFLLEEIKLLFTIQPFPDAENEKGSAKEVGLGSEQWA